MRFGRHEMRSPYSKPTGVRLSRKTEKQHLGMDVRVRLCGWTVFGILAWREGNNGTTAWLALIELVGFYTGIHRIDGRNHNWVF